MRFETVSETALADSDRAAIGALLAAAFDADSPEDEEGLRAHGHWGDAPAVRVLARDGERVVAQASVFRMGEGVTGLGDIAVLPSHRGRGIARELIEHALRLSAGQVVLARTVALRSVLAEHGFAPVDLPQLAPDPHWMGRGDLSRVGELDLDDV